MNKIITFLTLVFCTFHVSAQFKVLTKEQKKIELTKIYSTVYNMMSVMLYDQSMMQLHSSVQKYLEKSLEIQQDLDYLANLDSVPNFDIAVVLTLGTDMYPNVVKKSQGKLYDHMTYKKYDIVSPVFTSMDTNKFLSPTLLRRDFSLIMYQLGHAEIPQNQMDSLFSLNVSYDAVFEFVERGDETIYAVDYKELYFLQKTIGGLCDMYRKNKDAVHFAHTVTNLMRIHRLVTLVRIAEFCQELNRRIDKNGLLIINQNQGGHGLEDLQLIFGILNMNPDVYQFQ